MKKRLSFILICGIVLLCVCGCENEEKKITGTYTKTTNDNHYLKLYENGSCHLKNGMVSEYDTDECSYDYNDDEVKLNLVGGLGDFVVSCSYNSKNDTIDCEDTGIFEK